MEKKEDMGKTMSTYCAPVENSKTVYPVESKKITYANEIIKENKNAKCPDCDADLDVPKDAEKGEILSCPGCGLELEVKKIDKGCVDLQELTIEGEDWGE
jgi:alpha-aminoadipate carrier protein LysW